MGCKMNKIFVIGLVLGMLVCFSFAPMERQVVKGANTNIEITFNPDGNVSLYVSPDSYNYTIIYANSTKTTPTFTYFTIWNNGSAENMNVDAQITDDPDDMIIDSSGPPDAIDEYSMQIRSATCSGDLNWLNNGGTVELDNDLDTAGSKSFGLDLYIWGLAANYSWQSLNITLVGS